MEPIQSAPETRVIKSDRPRSWTELARIVAAKKGWMFDGNAVVEDDGAVVAASIEDLAAALQDLQWITDGHVFWNSIPTAPAAAARIRTWLQEDLVRGSTTPI